MTVDLGAVSEQWAREYSTYDRFTAALVVDVQARLRSAGIQPINVTGRPKDPATLVTKMIRKGYERYEDVTDKSGVRVVVRMDREVDEVLSELTRSYKCAIDDKRGIEEISSFGYRAVHLQALGPLDDFVGLESEIQIRTICADAWSEMSHFLAYKSPIPVPREIEREQHALAGLFELADHEYERQFDALMALPERRGAAMLEGLQPIRLRLSGAPWDHRLSVEMLSALADAYGGLGVGDMVARVEAWTVAREAELAELLREAEERPELRTPLLLQPEALVVGERLSARAEAVIEAWSSVAPRTALEAVAFSLGLSLP